MSDSNAKELQKLNELKLRLTNILQCLIKYKGALINTYTLTSQKPSILNRVSPFLRKQCADITQYMIDRQMPENPSKDLSVCLDCLKVALEPYDFDISILAPHLCEMVFINSEMNLNVEKIIETYLPDLLLDGVPSDGPQPNEKEEINEAQE
jgi:hypothetical protein